MSLGVERNSREEGEHSVRGMAIPSVDQGHAFWICCRGRLLRRFRCSLFRRRARAEPPGRGGIICFLVLRHLNVPGDVFSFSYGELDEILNHDLFVMWISPLIVFVGESATGRLPDVTKVFGDLDLGPARSFWDQWPQGAQKVSHDLRHFLSFVAK